MKEKTGSKYPNGRTQSFLYETCLNPFDFDCSQDKFSEDIAFIRKSEENNQEVCSWKVDVDDKLIVTNIRLRNPHLRIEIYDEGFRKIPAVTKRNKDAKKRRVKRSDDINQIFCPNQAITDPLKFVGRTDQISRIVETDLTKGRVFFITGERSTGKTSLCNIIVNIFEGNRSILSYYDLGSPIFSSNSFYPLYIDISSGYEDIESIIEKILEFMDHVSDYDDVTNKFTFGLGPAKYERSVKRKLPLKKKIHQIHEALKILKEADRHLVLILDEFEHFEEAKKFSKTLRFWTTQGVICFVVGTGEKFSELQSGHISIARNSVGIELSSLSLDEFKEIFYLAGMLAEPVFEFSSEALESLFFYSNGLPYFGQLFGAIILECLSTKFGSTDNFFQLHYKKKTYTIGLADIFQAVKLLPKYCSIYEKQCKSIETQIPGGKISLVKLVKEGIRFAKNTPHIRLPSETLCIHDDWIEPGSLLDAVIITKDSLMKVSDPVLRQYIQLTRVENIFPNKANSADAKSSRG